MPPKVKTEPGTIPASSSRSRKRPADTQTPESSVRKHAKTCYTDMITVLAGAEETPFIIHRINLCQTSGFLQEKCEEDGAEETVHVPAVRAPMFEIYVHWLYRGDIRLSVEVPRGASERRVSERRASETQSSTSTHHLSVEDIDFLLLSELYVAGISLIDQTFKNSVVDEIVMRMERWGTRQVTLSSATSVAFSKPPLHTHDYYNDSTLRGSFKVLKASIPRLTALRVMTPTIKTEPGTETRSRKRPAEQEIPNESAHKQVK
ncbi:hypothetical protein LTR97_001652 [Elasticomyces elasticus]|uniref:BTB domain-containing protein n=1 Tax=Elasticomyces elasticus TaxID=574655 RepID=A0AAN7WHY0_9PEZI|nr:hypothetical protein LTR97_001652 [Elasticomyces elasticus]